MICLIIILVIIIISLIMYILLQQRSLKHITRSVKQIYSKETNERVNLYCPNKSMEKLVVEVNKLLDLRQEEDILFKRQEKQLRSQISNISHDLRTPLTSILGYIQLINDEDVTEEEKKEYLNIIEKRARVLQSLITSFYDLSRLEANEYGLKVESVNISSILCELIASFYNDFVDKGFKVNVDLDESIPSVVGDINGVTRVFTNIMQNALNHGTNVICFSQKRIKNKMVTSISNEVANIEDVEIEHVFDRFFTKDRVRSGENTGLGLTIVKWLLTEMGHEVSARVDEKTFVIEIIWKNYN